MALATAACFVLLSIVSAGVAAAQAIKNKSLFTAAEDASLRAMDAQQREPELRRIAETERGKAEVERDSRQRLLYDSNMNLAKQAWDEANVDRVVELLDLHRPQPGRPDLRHFEWFYLDRLCHSDLLTLNGHNLGVLSVAFSPDGKRLASASEDKTVRLWDATTGQETLTIQAHTSSANSVAFSPDAKRLASASWDQTVKGEVTVRGWTRWRTSLALVPGWRWGLSAINPRVAAHALGLLALIGTLRLASSVATEPTAAVSAAPEQVRELLRDADFSRGLAGLAPKGAGRGVGNIRSAAAAATPVWQLAQWHSQFALTNFTASANSFAISNAAKWLCVETVPDHGPTVTLGVDSRVEYDGRLRRGPSEPWVHLLVQQEIQDAPSLAEPGGLRLRFETRRRETKTFRPEGHTPSLHAAQFQVVLTLNNTRRGSPGFGDYLWFVVPVYDDRYEVPPAHIARDFAVTKGKLIYNPGAAVFATNIVRCDGWARFDCDLRPWLERALRTAWKKGYLPDSRSLANYRVAHINVGWEVPGLNRVAMELRGLSLTTVTVEPVLRLEPAPDGSTCPWQKLRPRAEPCPRRPRALLVYAADQLQRHAEGALPRHGKRPRTKRRIQLFLLQGLPGIGPSRAAGLLERFERVEAVMTASAESLQTVDGIGLKTAASIRWALE